MLRNNLIIAWRNLMRHRHTCGAGLGHGVLRLAWRFASQEWSFDRFHSKADRIYRVYSEFTRPEEGVQRMADVIEFAFAPELETLSPHIERTVRLSAAVGSDRDDRVVRTTFAGSSSDEEVSPRILRFSRSSTSRSCGVTLPRRWPSATPSS